MTQSISYVNEQVSFRGTDLPFQTHRGFHPPDAMTSLGDPELECGRVAGSLPAVSRFGAAATVRVRNMGKNILVIDDDVDFLRLVEHTLKPYGYDPEIKASGQAGLDYFEKNCAEIKMVIVDVLMPGMMGPDLVERLRSFNPQIKILFASAYTLEILDHTTQSLFPLLNKPFKPMQVITTVREMLGESLPPR